MPDFRLVAVCGRRGGLSLHPAEIKDLHAQIVDVREQVSNGGIKGFIQPLNQSVPDGVYDILANVLESAAQGISQTRQDIA